MVDKVFNLDTARLYGLILAPNGDEIRKIAGSSQGTNICMFVCKVLLSRVESPDISSVRCGAKQLFCTICHRQQNLKQTTSKIAHLLVNKLVTTSINHGEIRGLTKLTDWLIRSGLDTTSFRNVTTRTLELSQTDEEIVLLLYV